MKAARALIVPAILLLSQAALGGDLYVAFWNVENLFDTVDDPAVAKDEEFTPTARKKWTAERLEQKLKDLARVIADMNAGRGPDVLGLCEVENRFVIEELIKALARLDRDYAIVHKDSPSGRGIDCALIFDRKVLELASADFLLVHGRTREIVEAELKVDGDSLFVFVNHWPARGGDPEGKGRVQAAKVLRKRIDALQKQDAGVDILVLGDLNDHPEDPSVRKHLGARAAPDGLPSGALYNSTEAFVGDPKRGTFNYRGKWEVIDHVILSAGLLDDDGFSWKKGSTSIIMRDYQLRAREASEPRPFATYRRDTYLGGPSDHMPVKCVLRRR